MTRDYVELEGGWFWWSTWSWSYMIIMVLILIIIMAKQFHHLGFPIMMTMIITMITMIIKGVKYKRWPPWRPAALWFSTTVPLFILTPPLCGISLTGLMMTWGWSSSWFWWWWWFWWNGNHRCGITVFGTSAKWIAVQVKGTSFHPCCNHDFPDIMITVIMIMIFMTNATEW